MTLIRNKLVYVYCQYVLHNTLHWIDQGLACRGHGASDVEMLTKKCVSCQMWCGEVGPVRALDDTNALRRKYHPNCKLQQ